MIKPNHMTIQDQLARHVIHKRKVLRLSQRELAFLADTSQNAIARFETGRGNPTLDLVQRLASALQLECIIYIRPKH